MRIVSYNIRFGGKGREGYIAQVLDSTKPDVVILVEANDPQVMQTLAQELGFPYFDSRQSYSVAFLSRIPPKSYQWHQLTSIRTPFLELGFEDDFRIIGVHLTAQLTRWKEQQRLHEVRQLIQLVDSLKSPHLLIGDFNAVAPGDRVAFSRMPIWLKLMIGLNGGVQSRALGTLIKHGYIDVFRHLHPDDHGYTLPPPRPNTRLDYAFVPTNLIGRIEDCSVVRQPDAVNVASDHYPLLIDFN